MRRAKIVCTLGPATDSYEEIRALVTAGMDVARMNMSHGTHEEHDRRYHMVRQAGDESERAVAVLADLQGPKIRTSTFASGPIELVAGETFTITVRNVPGDKNVVGTTYDGLAGDVTIGDDVLIDDGKVQLKVTDVTETDLVTTVVIGGEVSDHKGINLPGTAVSVPALSDKDADDLRWALRTRVDIIALSFVRSGKDIDAVHKIMDEEGGVRPPVIAKIEKPQAIENLTDIVAAFDGIMVARGDLGVELPLEQVPLVQKRAIEIARQNAKPVIVATQVLESMIISPRPTRAEVSDCANAVLDGADAIMLSGETSVGAWPIKAVETMATIIKNTEEHGMDRIVPLGTMPHTTGGAVTKAAADIAELLNISFMVTFTQTGDSARRMARLRSKTPMLAFTPVPSTRSQLAMTWGSETFLTDLAQHTDEMVLQVDELLLEQDRCQEGELIVIVAGSPPGTPGSTNALRVHRVGDAVHGRAPAYRKILDRGDSRSDGDVRVTAR